MILCKREATVVLLLIVLFFGIAILICKGPELLAPDEHVYGIAISQKAYEVIARYERAIAPKMRAFQSSGGLSDLARELEARTRSDPRNTWNRVQLGVLYKTQNQWRKAIEHFTVAHTQAPELADPLTGIGLVLYELALFDMTDRHCYRQADSGFPIFMPDQEARALLTESRDLLEEAKLIGTYRESRGITVYTFGPDTIDEHLRMIDSKLQMSVVR